MTPLHPDCSVTALLDHRLVDLERIPVLAYHRGDTQVTEVNGEELLPLCRTFGRISKNIRLIMMIDGPGGNSKTANRILESYRAIQVNGGEVWAMNRERAASAYGWLFCEAKYKVGFEGGEVMVHQPYMHKKAENGRRVAVSPLELAYHPVVFRLKLRKWIENNVPREYRDKAHKIASDAFLGPNPLDDTNLNVDTLNEWGLMTELAMDPFDFLGIYQRLSHIPEALIPKQFKDFLLWNDAPTTDSERSTPLQAPTPTP
jgi:hypothetical protein